MSRDSITYEGKTIDELKVDFESGINSYFEGCKQLGIEPRKVALMTEQAEVST